MSWTNPDDETVRDALHRAKTIAVVGCSPKPFRTSHQIAKSLQRDYRVIPVHPRGGKILGETVYRDLRDIPEPVDIVNVFRRSDAVVPIASAAVAIGAEVLWLQQGVINEEAYEIATSGGLVCVMDRCIAVLRRVLLG